MKRFSLTLLLSFFMISLQACAGSQSSTTQPQTGSTSSTLGFTIGNLLQGVFSSSDIDVDDMVGSWIVDGSAVAFKSQDLLTKAGGAAVAAKLQTDLDPYYERYGLTGAELTIDSEGNCKIQMKRGAISGVISKQSNGDFLFSLTLFGKKTASSVPLYVRKTSTTMDMMFDVAKLKEVMKLAARLSGMQIATTLTDLLDKYEGVYIGFGMHSNGSSSGNVNTDNSNSQQSGQQNTGLGTLINILSGKQNKK